MSVFKKYIFNLGLFSVLIVAPIFQSFSQAVFQKAYGGFNDEDVKHIAVAADGNLLIAGSTLTFGAAATDAYLFKTDDAGNFIWSKTFGSSDDDYFEWVEPTKDNGIILCGYSFSVVKQSFKVIVIKTDSVGNIEWQQQIPLSTVARAYCVRQTFDRGYILSGEEDSSGVDGNLMIVKLDSLGNLEWNKSYGVPVKADVGSCIIQTADTGYAVVGHSRFGLNSSSALILKTDSLGSLEWSKNYYNTNPIDNRSYPNRITEVDGNKLVVSGSSFLVGQPLSNVLFFSTDSLGSVLWSNLFSTGTSDVAHDLCELPEGSGFILAGHTSSPNTGTTNAMVLKCDATGNLLWNENYGNDTIDGNFYAAISKSLNALFLAGNSYSHGSGGQDIILAGRDSSAVSNDCNTHQTNFATIPFPLVDQGPVSLFPLSISLSTLNFISSLGIQFTDVCLSTGINNVISDDHFVIYPNPGNGIVTLENGNSEKISQIRLIDQTGRVVVANSPNSSEKNLQIVLPELSPGLYWFEILCNEKRIRKLYSVI